LQADAAAAEWSMAKAHQFFFRRRVEFADTDLAGIMHFANFFRFMEAAEHAFYRSLGFSVHPFRPVTSVGEGGVPKEGDRTVGWPRVHASADFRLPLHFEDEVEVELLIEEIRAKTIRYRFRFWKFPDLPDERTLAASGAFVVVAAARDADSGQMKAVAIPDDVRDKIEAAPEVLLGGPGAS
jgi:acyl-CoA thioester hydrolase